MRAMGSQVVRMARSVKRMVRFFGLVDTMLDE